MHLALTALCMLGALVLGLILGASGVRTVGEISLDAAGMLVPVMIYAVIGGGILVVVPPRIGHSLLLGGSRPGFSSRWWWPPTKSGFRSRPSSPGSTSWRWV